MTTIKGTIESIEYRNNNGHEKKVITIVPDHRQRAFVEARGWNMDKISAAKEGDEIKVEVMLEGKIAKGSGVRYNNLVVVDFEIL